uniref:Si605032f04 n=1 Tax=Arundo donax TaxID=35708 RepID=A0A0A9FUI9_ARUDO
MRFPIEQKLTLHHLGTLINSLQKEGFAACRSHIDANAIKTNCPIASCIDVARVI